MYKPVHRLAREANVMVSTRHRSLLKGTSRQTVVLPLLPNYSVDFIVDLILVFDVIIRQVVFVTVYICV